MTLSLTVLNNGTFATIPAFKNLKNLTVGRLSNYLSIKNTGTLLKRWQNLLSFSISFASNKDATLYLNQEKCLKQLKENVFDVLERRHPLVHLKMKKIPLKASFCAAVKANKIQSIDLIDCTNMAEFLSNLDSDLPHINRVYLKTTSNDREACATFIDNLQHPLTELHILLSDIDDMSETHSKFDDVHDDPSLVSLQALPNSVVYGHHTSLHYLSLHRQPCSPARNLSEHQLNQLRKSQRSLLTKCSNIQELSITIEVTTVRQFLLSLEFETQGLIIDMM